MLFARWQHNVMDIDIMHHNSDVTLHEIVVLRIYDISLPNPRLKNVEHKSRLGHTHMRSCNCTHLQLIHG